MKIIADMHFFFSKDTWIQNMNNFKPECMKPWLINQVGHPQVIFAAGFC